MPWKRNNILVRGVRTDYLLFLLSRICTTLPGAAKEINEHCTNAIYGMAMFCVFVPERTKEIVLFGHGVI